MDPCWHQPVGVLEAVDRCCLLWYCCLCVNSPCKGLSAWGFCSTWCEVGPVCSGILCGIQHCCTVSRRLWNNNVIDQRQECKQIVTTAARAKDPTWHPLVRRAGAAAVCSELLDCGRWCVGSLMSGWWHSVAGLQVSWHAGGIARPVVPRLVHAWEAVAGAGTCSCGVWRGLSRSLGIQRCARVEVLC